MSKLVRYFLTLRLGHEFQVYRCDEHTAQYTTTAASANLTFWGKFPPVLPPKPSPGSADPIRALLNPLDLVFLLGSQISVYGNYTGGMNWTMAVDGANIQTGSSSSAGYSPVLASWKGLSIDKEHVLTLNTLPGSSSTAPSFNLERADVVVDTGIA